MTTPPNKDLCIAYLNGYAAKDLKTIDHMFADDIILRDWKIRVVGKSLALAETQKNFDAVNSLSIEVLATYESEDTVAAELKIVIDDSEELYVTDVITFNQVGKITSIRAYVGRGDS